MILERKLNDELSELLKIFLVASAISIIFLKFFPKFINILIRGMRMGIKIGNGGIKGPHKSKKLGQAGKAF